MLQPDKWKLINRFANVCDSSKAAKRQVVHSELMVLERLCIMLPKGLALLRGSCS